MNYPFLTSKERDTETGLDFFGARYYGNIQGRFTSVDLKALGSRQIVNPQRWNRYTYVLNNPLALYDPDGQTDQAQDKSKVIVDIFLYANPEQKGDDRMTRTQRRELDKIRKEGNKVGVEINVHEGPVESTGLAARDAIKNSNVVIFGVHTANTGEGTPIIAVPTEDGTFTVGGLEVIGGSEPLSVEVNAQIVAVMGCDSAMLRNVFQGAETFIGVNGGADHASSTFGLNQAIIETARTIVNAQGDLGPSTISAIQGNAQRVIRNNRAQGTPDPDDRVIVNPALMPPPPRRRL